MGAGANALRVIVGLRPKIPIDEQLRNACFFGQSDVVEQILLTIPHGPGGPVDGEDPIGYTPIMYAAGSGYPQILEMLLQHGAAMNHVAQNGFTALHKAAEGGKIACLNVLLVWRADMNIQSVDGYSPAMCAVMEKKDIFLKRLIEAKCDLTLRDKKGNTALDLVKHGGTIEILEEGMQLRSGLEEQRRTILVEKRLLLQQKLKETREKEEAEKRAKQVREEAALKSSTEKALRDMAEQAKVDNEAFQKSLVEQRLKEEADAEAKRVRQAEIERTRSQGASERRIRIPTLAAFLSLQNHFILSKLLECSKRHDARTGGLTDEKDALLNLMKTLTERKKEVSEELVLLNVIPIVPAEYTAVGRWGGTLGQVDWLINQVTSDWKELQAGSKVYVDESQSETLQELHAMKLFFSSDSDSEARKLMQEREMEMQRKEREKTLEQHRRAEQLASDRARAQELLHKDKDEKARNEGALERARLVVAKELGLPLQYAAAFLAACNSFCLIRITLLSKLMNGQEVEMDDNSLKELQGLALIKKGLGQQLLSFKLSSLVPTDYADIETRCRRSNAAADTGAVVAMEEQASWLTRKIRELWLEDEGGADRPEEEDDEVDPETSCSKLIFDLARLLKEDESGAEGLHPVGTLAWKRDKVINTLQLLSARIHDPSHQGQGKAAILDATARNKSLDMLQRLERIQNSGEQTRGRFRPSFSASQQEEEDEARNMFLLEKAAIKEKAVVDAEVAEAKRRLELENEIRATEAASRAPPPTTPRLRAANAASLGALQDIIGSSKGKAGRSADVSTSLLKFREGTLGVKNEQKLL